MPSTLRSVRRKGTETHVTPEGVYKTDSSGSAWRCTITGVRATVSNTRGQPRETGSLSRLFGSMETTARCISMGPADCRKGVSNSVRLSTTALQRRDSHTGGPRAGSGYGTRSESPIKEGGHRGGPSSREGIRVLQPVFHSSQKGWRVASDHRSASTEPLSQSAEVQDAHAKASCVTNQVQGLVCHDRSKRRILPRIHPSVSQEVPKVRFWGQSIPISGSSLRSSTFTPHFYKSSGCSTSSAEAAGHPHTELYRRLADSSSVGDGGGETSRCRPRSYETVGVETKRQEKCAFSGSEDHLFRRGVEFDHDAGTNVACSDRVDFHVSQESERRPVTYCQAVSEIAGSDGSCVQCDTGWPAVHETPAVVAQDQGIFPEGKSTSHDQGLSTVCASPRHVEETLVLKSGPGAGSSVSPVIVSDGRVSHRLGSSHEWPLSPRSVEWSPSHMAHQLSRDVSGLSSTKIFPPRPERSPCVGAHRQHSGGLLHQPPGGSALAPVVQTGTPDPLVVPGQVPLTESTIYSWVPECGTRRTVETGAEARGMDASPRGGEADMENILSGGGGPLRNSSECAMSPLVLSSSSSSPGTGRYGTDMAEATSVRFSPDRSAPRSSDESTPRRCSPTVSSPVLAGPSMVLGPDFPPRRLSMGGSHQEGSPLTSRGCHSAPPPGVMETVGVAPEGAQLIASGLPAEVVETILQSRAPSTRKVYNLRWKFFTSWCRARQQDPVNCPVGTVLEYLQARLSAGVSHSTVKVHVAALSAYHSPLDGNTVGKHPLVIRFLRGALRMRPPVRSRVPTWDLAVVLEALCKPPFEPIEEISDRHLSLKTTFLLAITSLKRVGDLQALSVAPSYLDFAPGLAKAFLYPRAGYTPKVPTTAPRPVVLQAFHPPPFRDSDQVKLNCMCPVRALDTYVHRATQWRRSDQLLVCVGPPRRGLPASKHTISRWIVETITACYESSGLPSPLGVKAHSTRGVAASKAFSAGVPVRTSATLRVGPPRPPLSGSTA